MKTEDESSIAKLVTDYMCWWDDRIPNKDYPARLDDSATWELWLFVRGEEKLLAQYSGKAAILAAKTPGTAIVHSTSNLVIHSNADDHADVRGYFRTYFQKDGSLFTHGEGRYELRKINGEWRLMAIRNHYYWLRDKRHERMKALKIAGMLVAAMIMGALAGALV